MENDNYNKRRVGAKIETYAARKLSSLGYEIVDRNFYCRHGEIDLIAKKDGYLVFIEVKYRGSTEFGLPEEAVNFRKQRKILAAARYYLFKNKIPFDTPCRFDVVGVIRNQITVTENAFEG